VAGAKKQWLLNMLAYTGAGLAASMLIGTGLGWVGGLLMPPPIGKFRLLLMIAIALAAITRELGWTTLPLPQLKRQTKDIWVRVFPRTVASALWGFDLGLTFTTYLTFSGVWLLFATAISAGQIGFGAALFAMYWLGRTLSVWVAPLLMPDASATPRLLDGVSDQRQLFNRIHALGLAWAVIVLTIWSISIA
jgi:hypothetical protein